MDAKDLFAALFVLKQQLNNQLQVTHASFRWTATFTWLPPVASKTIEEINKILGKPIPIDYACFLSEISNGATLYYEQQYGQWGFRIYGTDELLEKQDQWAYRFEGKWQAHFMAFGECYGDANVLLFDLERPNSDGLSCAVIEGNAYDPINWWPIVSRSFHEWLANLITAQGDKYWEWK